MDNMKQYYKNVESGKENSIKNFGNMFTIRPIFNSDKSITSFIVEDLRDNSLKVARIEIDE